MAATADRDTHVALFALDQLGAMRRGAEAVAALERAVADLSDAGSPRGWHRAAHALVALAAAAPERGAAVLPQFTGSRIWQLRMYAARAAAALDDRDALERWRSDDDDNVREAAVEGLRKLAGHDADAIYIAQLSRRAIRSLRAVGARARGHAASGRGGARVESRVAAAGRARDETTRTTPATRSPKRWQSLGADPRGRRSDTRVDAVRHHRTI